MEWFVASIFRWITLRRKCSAYLKTALPTPIAPLPPVPGRDCAEPASPELPVWSRAAAGIPRPGAGAVRPGTAPPARPGTAIQG